ncbi:MAG TPA: flagellar motor protein MotB [Polaromonas sp.]|nr:flagellar motor protein MotB [Polaromonas sp.]
MSDHDRAKDDGAIDSSQSKTLPPNGPSPASAPRRALKSGRFARWHLEPAIVPDEDGWLLTYLDLITLLLTMMVLMLSFAGPGKHGAPVSAATGAAPLAVAKPEPEPDPLAGLLLDNLGKNIEVVVNKGTVSFRISSEVLFNSGEANLSAPGLAVMGRLVPVLDRGAGYRVVVEGHTDNVPIQTERFPSNWELSTGRAASVVRYLQSQGIKPARMRATGYADTRPVASNGTPQGRAANRHVEVTLEASK